jgi:flagellar hook-basal body complex protein FliE
MSGIEGLRGLSAQTGLQGPRTLRDVEPQRGITLQKTGAAPQASFADTLAQTLGEVNDLQLHADQMVEQFAAGKVQDLHQVVIAQQEAAIAFKLVQEVRDKLLQGYQEIMRMQM